MSLDWSKHASPPPREPIGLGPAAWLLARRRLRLLIDLAVVATGLLAATFLTFPGRPPAPETLWLGASLCALWTLTATLLGQYDSRRKRTVVDDVALVSLLVLGQAATLALIARLRPVPGMVPSLGLFLLLVWPLALAVRLLLGLGRHRGELEPEIQQVVIVGAGPLARVVAADLARLHSVRLVAVLPLPGEAGSGPFAEERRSLEQVLREAPVTEVYLTGDLRAFGDELQAAASTCERLGVGFAMPASGLRLDRAEAGNLKQVALQGFVHYRCLPAKPWQWGAKRAIDILGSAGALAVLSPLLLLTAACVKATSKGPIFFAQSRSGLHGRVFQMWKFRSMVADAERLKAQMLSLNEQSGPVFKIRRDPRITPVGRFLRKYSIDELPQLWNVLVGEMSLVGPRPPVPEEVKQYQAWQRRRLSVRPGLTCVWQVSGRNELSFEQWMYLDLQYIDNWQLSHDFGLLWRTLPAVLSGRGAS